MLGLIDDPFTQDLQERQSKLVNASWIGCTAAKDESCVAEFRDGLINIKPFEQ